MMPYPEGRSRFDLGFGEGRRPGGDVSQCTRLAVRIPILKRDSETRQVLKSCS